ncbi:MAG: hypothetical protein JXR36_04430 [Bacteroidales bacterium]|nr:hypothetical protein [Bacteroidales bacterium]
MDTILKFNALPVAEKMRFAKVHESYLLDNINQFIQISDLDELYLQITNDDSLKEILADFPEVRWEYYTYLGEMTALGSDGADDYEYFTDTDYLSNLLFSICSDNSVWFNRIIHNKLESGSYVLSSVGLVAKELEEFFSS